MNTAVVICLILIFSVEWKNKVAATSSGGKLIYFVFNTSSGLTLQNIWIFSPVLSGLYCLGGEFFPHIRWLSWKKDLENHQNRETLSRRHVCGTNHSIVSQLLLSPSTWLARGAFNHSLSTVHLSHFLHQKNILKYFKFIKLTAKSQFLCYGSTFWFRLRICMCLNLPLNPAGT